MRKKLFLFLLCILTVLCGFVACADEEKPRLALVDFPVAAEETVELGATYRIEQTSVKDQDGNEYRLIATVVTADGKKVDLFDGRFDVTELGGYTITYTLAESTQTSVVRLQVVDRQKPTVSISDPLNGKVGEAYVLPQIFVSDLSGQIVSQSVEVYFLGGSASADEVGEKIELTATGGEYRFTPTAAGYYRIQATATDRAGNAQTKTATFIVEDSVPPSVIFDPAMLSAEDKIKTSTSCPMEIVENADGDQETYIKFTADTSATGSLWHSIYLEPYYELTAYEDYDFVEVWLYADAKDDTNVHFSFFNHVDYRRSFRADTWTKVVLTMDDFIERMSVANTPFLPFNTNNKNSTNHVSLTELRLGKIVAVKESAQKILLPTLSENAVAGVELTLPQATLFVNGVPSATLPNRTAQFFGEYGGEGITVEGNTFTPPSKGIILITYTYGDAYEKTLTIAVDKPGQSKTKVLDFSTIDVLSSMNSSVDTTLSYDATEKCVTWTLDEGAVARWRMIWLKRTLEDSEIKAYAYVKVTVKGLADGTGKTWNFFACSDKFVKNGLACNEWLDFYIPTDIFVGQYEVVDGYYSVSEKLDRAGLKGVSLKGFELVNEAVLLDPTTGVGVNTLSKSSSDVKQETVKGSASELYTGDYLRYSEGTGWCNLTFSYLPIIAQENARVEVWVYYGTDDAGNVSPTFFNSTAHVQTFAANTWVKLTFTATDFVTTVEETATTKGKHLVTFKMGNTVAGQYTNLAEVRIGSITVVENE